jgi:hypothetical protein
MSVPRPQQLHAHGGQLWPAMHAGHAHPHPDGPPSSTGFTWTHAPLGHGVVMQTMPSSIQLHEFALSAVQAPASPCPVHGSTVALTGDSGATIVVVTPTLPAPHAQSHGAQVAPGAQVGHAQVQVPPPPPPAPPHETPPPLAQSHVHGAQAWPGGQVGHAQVQVPPPPPAPVPGGGLEQSHWTAGQAAFAGHAIGCTQVQPPPEASRA